MDLIVCRSVAVSRRDGVRVGKGAAYSDLEIALLTEAGLVTKGTAIATTIHQIQLLDEELPHASHDLNVDLAITPTEVLNCTADRDRPASIITKGLRLRSPLGQSRRADSWPVGVTVVEHIVDSPGRAAERCRAGHSYVGGSPTRRYADWRPCSCGGHLLLRCRLRP